MPHKSVVLGDQQVGMTVTVEVYELEIGIAEVAVQAQGEGSERFPTFGFVVLVKAGRWAAHHNHVRLSIARKIHELRVATSKCEVWFEGNQFERRELCGDVRTAIVLRRMDRAEISLVEPRGGLLANDARNPFAMKIGPLISSTIQPRREVFQAVLVHFFDGFLDDWEGVLELDRRQTSFQIAAVLPLVTALADRKHKRVNRITGVPRFFLVRIGEVGRTHEAVFANTSIAIEVMEREDALAQACRAHLEGRAIGGERVVPIIPLAWVVRFWGIGIMFAVVEDDFEHPVGLLDLRYAEERWARSCTIQHRYSIAIANSFEIAVGCPARIIGSSAVTFARL